MSKDKAKDRAHSAVTYAIRKGTLIKEPCAVCGNPVVEAHHEDYDRPLDVAWLCKKHHTERHHELGTYAAKEDYWGRVARRQRGQVIRRVIDEMGTEDKEAIIAEVHRRLLTKPDDRVS